MPPWKPPRSPLALERRRFDSCCGTFGRRSAPDRGREERAGRRVVGTAAGFLGRQVCPARKSAAGASGATNWPARLSVVQRAQDAEPPTAAPEAAPPRRRVRSDDRKPDAGAVDGPGGVVGNGETGSSTPPPPPPPPAPPPLLTKLERKNQLLAAGETLPGTDREQRARPGVASVKGEGSSSSRPPTAFTTGNAVARRFRTHATDIGHAPVVPVMVVSSRRIINRAGGRAIAPEHGIDGHRATHASIARLW